MGAMRPTTILRSLSFLRPPMWSEMKVAPLPETDPCNHLTAPFPSLRRSLVGNGTYATRDLLDNVIDFMSDLKSVKFDKMPTEEYLEDGVELLDICNFLLEKIELIKKYVDSIQMAFHWVRPADAVTRVRALLDEKKYNGDDVYKCRSRLKKLVAKEKRRRLGASNGQCNELTNSMSIAVEACQRLDRYLSLKHRGPSSPGESTVQMGKLRDVIMLARELRDRTAKNAGEVDQNFVDTLKKNCDKLVQELGPLEVRVKELYSQLIRVRMALLNKGD